MADGVKVTGLAEIRKALKTVEPNAGKMLRTVYKAVSDLVVADAKSNAASLGGVAAKSAGAVKAQASQSRASISIDSSGAYPFAMGAEFGAKQYPQFHPWRGNQYEDPLSQGVGYFMHPAIRQDADKIERAFQDGIDGVITNLEKD